MQRASVIIIVLVTVLAACGQNPTPTPAAIVEPPPAVVSASGKLLPVRWAALGFQAGGQVVAANVQFGDVVKAGDVLVQLDDTDASLAVAQAEAALAIAQAQLEQLKAGAQPEQVASAEQSVKSAEAAVWGAAAQLARLQSGATVAEIAAAEATVAAAAVQKKIAQDNYDRVDEIGGWMEEQFRAVLNAANQEYAAAQKQLEQLEAGASKNELDAVRANVAVAQAQKGMAQAQLDLLKAGATHQEIAVAEANVKQAQVALDGAKDQLNRLRLEAPFDGTVGIVQTRQGEQVAPGQSVVMLGDLSTLRVETTDLSELDVARVQEGQSVDVTFDALPGVTIPGKVTRIAPMATPGQSGVNYVMIVELDRVDPALRWGMTAFVDVQVGQ